MLDLRAMSLALSAIAVLAVVGWLTSVARRNVGIVDSLWSLFFLLAALVFAGANAVNGPRTTLLIVMVALWALRLSGYITWRNHGEPEDRRYQAIRAANEPGFVWKSLFIVFAMQGLLALIIAAPLFVGIASAAPLNALDGLGGALWASGFAFEAIGDLQLARFKGDPANRARVMDTGLWRYTRHPNYFGEATLWWGYYLVAVAAGAWWTIFSPLLMTFLLLKVSGVRLLEKDIGERRPAYRDYIARTNAFVPGPRRDVAR
jgi:steroid 5-alpha reductase family enzyme